MATIQEAYQAACNAGFIKRNEFSEEAFGNMLQNDKNRRAYYDHVTNIDPTFYSKDYDTFSQNVLSALGQPDSKNITNQPSNAPTPSHSQVQPTSKPAQWQPTFWQSIGAHDPYPQKTAEGVKQLEKEQQLYRESAATMPLSQQDKDRQYEIQRLQTDGIWGKPNGITMDIDKQTGLPKITQTKGDGMHLSIGATPSNQDEIDRLKAEQPAYITREIRTPQDLYTSVSEAWAANTPDGQRAKSELDKTAQDTYNNLLADMNRQIADLQQQVNNGTVTQQQAQQEAQRIADNTNAIYDNEMQLAQDYFFRQMMDANADYLSQQARLLGQKATNQTISDINARIAPHIRQLETERQQAMQRASQSVQAQGGMYGAIGASMSANTAYKPEKDKELALYHQSQQLLADAAKISDAAQKGEGFWKGLGKSLGDIDTWDFGISQLTRSANLKDIVEKYERGEQLTDAEKGLMDSAVAYMSACAYNSDKINRRYKMGQTTGESIPFMLQFMVMPIGSIKDKVAKGVLGYGIEQFGGKAAQAAGKAAAKYGAKTAFKEAGTALLSNLAAAGVQTAAFGVPKIAEGAISRMTGDIQPTITEQGNITYGGRQNKQGTAEAIWNSAVDMYAENLSEMILTSLDPLKAYAGTSKLFSGLKNSQIAQVLGRLNEGVIGKVRDRVQFRNYLEEVGEEYVGNLIRWGLSTDVNNAEDAGLSADQQIDTWLGLAPTSIAFGAANIVEGGIDRFQSSRAAKRLREIMADGDKRKYLESLLKSRNSDDFSKNAHEVIKTVLRDKELNEDTKRLIMDGIYSTYQSQLAQEAEQARTQAEAERQAQPEQPETQNVSDSAQPQTQAQVQVNTEGEEHYQDAYGNEITLYRNADGSVTVRGENGNAAVDEHGHPVVLTKDEFDSYAQVANLRRVDRELSADQWAERENELRQQYEADIRPNTHNDGNVYEVAIASDGNKHGYIVGDGNVEIDDTTDHSAPRITNSDVVTVRYEDGDMEQVAAKDLNLLSVGSANDIVEQRLQPFQQYEQAMQTFRAGQEVTMDDGNGNTYTSRIVSVSEDGVEVEIENPQGEPDTTIIPNEIALTALHPVEQKQTKPQEPLQPEQEHAAPQPIIVPNIDTMPADELGTSTIEYMGDKASAVAYLEAERDKANADVKRLAKQKVTRYTDIVDFKRQNDELQAEKKAASDRYNKLQNAIAAANNYKTKVEQAAEASRKARDEEKHAARRQTQTAQLANAAPAERWKAAPKVEGNAVTRTLSDGTVIKGHYILVEAGAATPSHDPFNGWNTSNGFPVTDDGKNINDRDYKNDTDAQQITTQIAQTYDGQAVAQVPVVSSDGIVYDGNGRTIAGNIAAANNTDGAYIKALADNAGNFGFTAEQVAGMKHPRVYMQTDEDLPYNTTTFAKFNAQEKKSQGSTNRAVSSSKKLTEAARDGMLRILDNYGTIDAFFASETGAKDIVRSLLDNGIITQQEVAGLTEATDKGFVLSPAGKDYITDLLIGGLFDEQTIRMLGNDKGLKQSILRAMPSIVENRRLGDYALTDNINNAIRLLYEARQAGMAYHLFIKQGNAFDGYVSDRFSPFEMLLAEEMSSGVETFRQVLNLYNNSARNEANGQAGLFEPRTFDDIKKEILQHYGKSTDQSAATAADSTPRLPANTQTEPPVPSTPTGDEQGEVANLPNASQIAEEVNKISNTRMSIDDSRVSNEQLAELQALYTAWSIGTEENQSENYTRLKDKVTELSNQQYYTMRDMDELTARIDEELGGRADRKSGYAAVQHLMTSNPELGREFLRQNNINNFDELKEWCAKRQYKLRVGKGKESREAAAQANVDAILGMAHRSAEESTQQEPQAAESAEQNQQSNSEKAPKDEQSKDNGGKEQSKSQQSENNIFTEDAYEAARRRMHERLNRLNAGLDPEMLSDGLIMAGYHVEKGARKFAEFAREMIREFGDKIRPYLKSFYNGLRDLPEAVDLSKEMDDYSTVMQFDVNSISIERAKETKKTSDILPSAGKSVTLQTEKVNVEGLFGALNTKGEAKLSDHTEQRSSSLGENERYYTCNGESVIVDRSDYKTYLTDKARALFTELSKTEKKPLAIPSAAYISYASKDGVKIPAEVLLQDPNIQAAQAKIDERNKQSLQLTEEQEARYVSRLFDSEHGSAVLNKDGKINKRNGEEDFSGEVVQGRKALFVIGRPAGGKSSVYANPLSAQYKARIIDSDVVKPWLDGFDGGDGAGYVQAASSNVADKALEMAIRRGDNVVIPKIGGNSIIKMAVKLRQAGYSVELYYNEVSEESSIMRASARFAETGRYLAIDYLESIKDKAEKTFINYANKTLKEVQDERPELFMSAESVDDRGYGQNSGLGLGENEKSIEDGGTDAGGYLFSRAEWKNNDVGFGEPTKFVWSSDSKMPIPGTDDVRVQHEDRGTTQNGATPAKTIGTISQSTHTKTGEAIFVVKPSERVSDDEFKLLKSRAKANNGYYSSFAKNRGFIFKSKEDANNFNNISDEEITTDQTSADTETAVRTAETVVGETATITRDRRDSNRAEGEPGTESIEGGVREPRNVELTPEQANEQVTTRQQAIAKIDNANDKITDQLAVLGFYEADTSDPTKFHESYGYIKTAEAKAVKDIDRLAKQLADDLGIKVSKRKTIAKANIAPAGGDISFRLPLENGKELYLTVDLRPNYELNEKPYRDVSEDSLTVDGIMWRIEDPQASGMARYALNNQYCGKDVKYIDLLNDIRRKSKEYLPTIPTGTTKQEIAKQIAEKNTRKKKDTTRIADAQPMLDLFGDVTDTMNEGAQQEQDGWNTKLARFDEVEPINTTTFTEDDVTHGRVRLKNGDIKDILMVHRSQYIGTKEKQRITNIVFTDGTSAKFEDIAEINVQQNSINNGNTEVRNDGRGENGTAQTEPTRQSRDENGTLGGSEQPQDERPVGRRVDTGSKPHRVHDGERGRGTAVQPTEQTVTQSEQTDIEPSQWRNTHNFHARGGERISPTAPKERYEANLAAIRLLKQLQDEGRQATAQEKDILAQYSGWGGLGEFFKGEPGTTYYSVRGEKSPYQTIKELLTDEEMEASQLSRNSAYYTPDSVINSMWKIAERLGFKGGNILEGSAGIGNIFALMPADISHNSNLTAVEIDDITAGILAQLYPDADVHHAGFQEVDIPNNSQDLVITNVPFVTGLRVYDKVEKDLSKRFGNIHDFCIAKNVRKLKQGGLGIFISSSGTLDNSKDLRIWLNGEGETDVIGAFRLNRNTFEGTTATSDIIVVRKRVNGQKDPRAINMLDTKTGRIAEQKQEEVWDSKKSEWVKPEPKPLKLIYNAYFVENPTSMGGEMGFGFEHGDTRWGGTTAGCYPVEHIDQERRLASWVNSIDNSAKLPTYEDIEKGTKVARGTYEEYKGAVPYGSLILNSKGEICKAYHGEAIPVDGINSNKVKGHSKEEVLKDYNAIKEAISRLLKAQETNISDKELKPYLDKLNTAYDDFVSKYGSLNKNTSIAFLRNDVQWASIAAIEKVKETVDINGKKHITVSKTDLFQKRVVGVQAVPKAENTRDGIILSMQQFGTIRPDKIAEWLGKPTDEVREEIIETRLGFVNPQTGDIQVRYEYLSGNVREKLAYAEQHNENGELDANIEELRKVIPIDIPAHLIEFNIGSTWIPKELYLQYAKEKYDLDDLKLNHVGSSWVSNDVWGRNEKNRSEGVYSDMLGVQIYGHELMLAAMNNVPVVVSRVEKHSDGTSETRTDKVASAACSDKISQIKDDFVDWARGKMQQDSELADRIQKIYNDRFNAIVPMLKVDKEFLSEHLPGQNSAKYTLYPHQQQAVARGLTQALMLAHEVGTGKTISLISTAMEMRRLGTAKKPMIVVQNATTQQFVADAKDLYPNAKILTVNDRDRTADGRQEFYAKIKYNDWDLIIVPQSVFDMIPDSESRMQDFINEKIEEKMHAIEAAKDAGVDSKVTKRMEKELEMLKEDLEDNNMSGKRSGKKKEKDAKKAAEQRANAEAHAQEMLDRKTDDIENFDEMGIDALLIDEAHNYKHLGFATMMTRGVKGVDPSYSKRAAALYLKCQSIYERNGHKNVIFATGTPISNTAAEIWTFMKYLMPKQTLQENEIYYFDDFVHNFGKINEQLEFATNGKFKANNRFAQYGNVPELMRLWLSVADCTLTREVGQVNDKVPELEGGKAQDIFLPQSPSLINIMASVRAELEKYEKMSGKEKKENSHIPLTMYGIAKRAAIDPRLVDSAAVDEPLSKTNRAVEEILRSLNDSKKYKGTVAIFCDSYQNKQSGFNLFNDIKEKLTKQGVSSNQIAIIRSEMSDSAKQKIFDAVREGDIRVIMGSTQTLGTGVNIQTRLHTLIHMDAPDRPMDYTQRNGRILRQGNMHKEWGVPVRVLRFGVEDSLDVTSYQRLKTKAGFIDSVMNGKSMIENNLENRVLEDVDEGIFDNPVAMLSGSQYALLKSQAERDLRKWSARAQQYRIDQILIAKKTKDNEKIIAYRKQKISDNEKLIELLSQTFPGGKVSEYNINGTVCHTSEEVKNALKEVNKDVTTESDALRKDVYGRKKALSYPITLNGVHFNVDVQLTRNVSYKDGQSIVSIEKEVLYSAPTLGIEPISSPTKVIDRLINMIQDDIISGKQARDENAYSADYIKRLEKENILMREREGKPFEHQAELEKAQTLVDEYTKKMQAELAEKEAKYANQSHNSVNLDKMDSEDDVTDTAEAQYDELDYDTDNLTDAQQFDTDVLLGALDEAGISVERVSEEQAEREMAAQKKSLDDTATWSELMVLANKAADITSNDNAKVLQKIETAKQKIANKSGKNIKNIAGVIADAAELSPIGSSHYGTFKATNGDVFTIRVSNHNATISNFDNENEADGVSIVISNKPNTGISNDGSAHIVEYFYRKADLLKSYGNPIADILGAMKTLIESGEYTDPTGLAQRQEVNIPAELQSSEFSIRQTPAPKNTGIGYKVFYRGKDGKLYPPMVANPNGADTPIGVWLNADAAPISGESKTGRPQVKAGGRGTQGGSGQLAYRPGWHLGEIPYALQFNRKDENGNKTLFPKDFVWAEVEYAADVNYQQEAEKEGITENGKYRHSYAGLKYLPTDGYYRYRTNPNPETDPWIITGAMKVNRVLTNEEVDDLVRKAGREPQQREFLRTSNGTILGYAKDGKIYLTDRGFNPNTPIHEYTHLWVKAVRNNNAELYDNLRDLFSRENLPDMWDELDNDPQYRNLSDEAKLSEIIARFSGKRGAERMEQETQKLIDDAKKEGKRAVADAISFRERMRNLLSRFWNWVGENLFHIKHFGSREEAADRVLYDILNATDLHQSPAEKDSQSEFSTSPMPKRMDGEMVHEWAKRIAEWKRQQVDEQQVAEYAKLLDQNDSKKSKVFAYIVDKFTPIDNFQQWVQAQGGVYNPDTMDMHSDISLALGRIETFSRRYKNDYMQRIADRIAQIAKDNYIADQLLALGLKWQNFDNKKMNGKPLTIREIMGVYAQAKDTWEADQQGLSDRGAQGFVKNLGVSHTDIIEAVERIIPKKQLDEFWNDVYAANQFALDYQLNAGMIDPDTRNRYTRRYYVPQRGWRERDFDGRDTAYIKDNGTRLYGNPYNAALVKAHGRESLASDPFAIIESIGLTSIRQSEHNKSKQQLLNLLLANEMLGLKSGAWRVKQVWSKNVIDPRTGHIMRKPDGKPMQAEVTYAAPTQQEREHDADINAQIEQLRKELRDLTQPTARAKREAEIANLQDQLIYTGRATDTMLEHRTRDERLQHQIIVLHNGQQYVIELQDERLANAVNGNFGEAVKAYALFNKFNAPAIRYISGMLTQYNPRFAHRNFWRDAQAAFLNNLSEQGVAFTTRAMANIPIVQRTLWRYILADTYKGKEEYTGLFGDYLREYFEAGAQTGFSFMPELERMAKDFDKMVKGENAWDKVWGKGVKGTLSLMTEASELTVRFAEYVTARQMGRSVQEAAKLAKNISVNFNQSGLMSKEMSKFFTFFNATVQGNMRFLMPYGKNKPKFGERAFKFGAKFAGMAANFALLGLLSTFLQPDNPDDDTWFTEYDRMSNFILFGKVKIPIVHFFRMFYAAGVQAALAAQGRKTWKDAFYTSADYTLGELVPASALQIQKLLDYDETTNTIELNPAKYAQAAAPSVISPLVDVAVNRDFKGSTVYRKKWDNDKKDITTAKRNTPQWAVDVSNTLHRWSGGNPDVPYKGGNTDGWIDIKPNAIEHLAQGYFSGVWESLGHTAGFIWDGAHDADVYKHATNWPFLRDLFRDYSEEKAYNQQYYSVLQKLEKYEKRVNTLPKEKFNEEKQTNRFQTFKQVSRQLRRLPNPYDDEETKVTSDDVNKILQLDIQLNRNLFDN